MKAVTLFLHKKEFEGLSIVDTPGLNDPIASRTIRTKEFMEVCDVVFSLASPEAFWIRVTGFCFPANYRKMA